MKKTKNYKTKKYKTKNYKTKNYKKKSNKIKTRKKKGGGNNNNPNDTTIGGVEKAFNNVLHHANQQIEFAKQRINNHNNNGLGEVENNNFINSYLMDEEENNNGLEDGVENNFNIKKNEVGAFFGEPNNGSVPGNNPEVAIRSKSNNPTEETTTEETKPSGNKTQNKSTMIFGLTCTALIAGIGVALTS